MTPAKKAASPRAARSAPRGDDAGWMPISVRFDPEHIEKAKRLAKIKGLKYSNIIQMALAEKLERDLK